MVPYDTLIVIPARYHSSRFPGKPLHPIAGKPMLLRVWEIAQSVAHRNPGIDCVVTTEDQRIVDFCQAEKIAVVLTSDQCESGTERAAETLRLLGHPATFIINLQGDNPLCPPWFLEALISAYRQREADIQLITPYVQLDWSGLDALRRSKEKTPFSGTTVVFDRSQRALWFSKEIIPAIRKEAHYRGQPLSPVCRHVGLYGYHRDLLLNLDQLAPSRYESYEGLEQLTFLENHIPIQLVKVDYRGRQGMTGIDSPDDVVLAEQIIEKEGELL